MDSETDGTKKTQKIGIIGAGAWGSAIAKVLADKGYQVEIWCYEPEVVAQINTQNTNRYLMGVRLPRSVHASPHIEEVTEGRDFLFVAVPSL